MSEYKIEKGIEIPQGEYRSKYPFRKMEVGDSVFIKGITTQIVWGTK